MFNFVRVVVGPGVRTAAVAWEAPAKRSQAFYLFLSDDRSIVGAVATRYCSSKLQVSGVAAAYQMLLLLLLLQWASQQQKKVVVVHQSGRKRSERAIRAAKLCG